MKRDALSFSQWMALLFGALLAPAIELLPGSAAQAGLLGTLAVSAGIVLLGAGGIIGGTLAASGDLSHAMMQGFGSILGKTILFLYFLWGEFLLILRLRAAGGRMLASGEQNGAFWFFILVLGGLAWWMGRGSLGALGRTAQLFVLILLVTGGVVVVLSFFQLEPKNYLIHWNSKSTTMRDIILPGIEVVGYGLFALFLYRPSEKTNRNQWFRLLVWVWIISVFAQMVMIGCFGSVLVQEMDTPFLQLAKSMGVRGVFQRVESIVAALWVFSDLLLLALILSGMRELGKALNLIGASEGSLMLVLCLVAVILAIVIPEEIELIREQGDVLLSVGHLVFGLALPGITWIVMHEKR